MDEPSRPGDVIVSKKKAGGRENRNDARPVPGAALLNFVSTMLSKAISILNPYPDDCMNQVRHRFASHTYATRSCLLTVVAIRFHVPIDNSVQGMMVTADSRGNRVRLLSFLLQAKRRGLTFSLVYQVLQT